MRIREKAFGALAIAAAMTLTATVADARTYYRHMGPTYTYGADRSNPSISPNGVDQDNPRDQQLQGK
jgi:hypothetical protein